jgi:dienelactone hydrolase
MTLQQISPGILLVGVLGTTIAGCSTADGDAPGTGGTTNGMPSSGGSAGSGTGGSFTSGGNGQSAAGGQPGGGSPGLTGGSTSGGSSGTGGSTEAGGAAGTGGSGDTGGVGASGGIAGSIAGSGGSMAMGGAPGAGGRGSGGQSPMGGSAGSMATGGRDPGTCVASKATGSNANGSGPHDVTVETNSGDGIKEGTIFRPTDLGGDEKYPIFVWGEGGCSQDGLSNAQAMAELASHGYFVVADGTPNGSGNRPMDRSNLEAMGAPLVAYIDWAIAENDKPCSAYYQSLDPTKVASNGFSCGGLMSQATVTDPRIVTWGVNSSGMAGADQAFYDLIHTPVLFVEGGPDDVAYDGGLEGYEAIAKLDVPVLWFSKALGHGGDLFSAGGGDFNKINLAWLNWWLKGDETATGKGLLVGAGCPYCSDSAWEYKSAHIP